MISFGRHCSTEGDAFWTRKVSRVEGDVTLFSFLRDWIASGHEGTKVSSNRMH